MAHIHYKFSSKLSYATVLFDGPHITLRELKRQIMGKERLRAGDCDLQITDAQSKQEYTDDEAAIPKGSSVIVRRIPVSGGRSSKSHKSDPSVGQFRHSFEGVRSRDEQTAPSTLHFFSKMANLADADASEEDKIQLMINQSIYDPANYNNKCGAVLPEHYTCYRCGNVGHHIRNCPSVRDKGSEAPLRIKKSTGIPRSFMVEVDDPSIKGAMLTNCGRYAIPAIDAAAYAIGKKERPPFLPQETPESEPEEDPVPDELLCLICHDLLSDSVVIPCCGNSYCDDCIRTTLLESEEHTCPTCSQQNVSPDSLIANKFLRQAVNNYKKERCNNKSQTQKTGTSHSRNPTPGPSPAHTPPPPPPPTPPPAALQREPQKPLQSTSSQQAANTLNLSGNPVAATEPTSPCNVLKTEPSPVEIPHREAEREPPCLSAAADHDDSVVAPAPFVLVPDKDQNADPSQLKTEANDTEEAESLQSDQYRSSGKAQGSSSSCWQSSSSSSACPAGEWTESQQLTSSPTPPPPPLFRSPHYHTHLAAHQSHSTYPPGFPPAPPIWTLPCPQGAPTPSPSSSASTSSIPSLVPNEWYRHQRKKEERSPHGRSTYRHSSCNSPPTNSKSSRSHSHSSSRSRSRSRSTSQGKSRPRSHHSRHRTHHSRSSSSYSYGYKRLRSSTPSSSSSPRVGYRSRSKSPSDHRKKRHHSRKSSSSGYCSTRHRERSDRKERGSSHYPKYSSKDVDRENYRQWKKQYKEWCEQYFSSYMNHFQQLPLPYINLPPPPPPQWQGSKYDSHTHSESHHRSSGRRPLSQSSSDSRSPSSHSSSDGYTTSPRSSRSSPSRASIGSRSPRKSRPTPPRDAAETTERRRQKDGHLPVTLKKEMEGLEEEWQERSEEDKQVTVVKLEDHRPVDPKQKALHTEDLTEDRKMDRLHNTGPHTTSAFDQANSHQPKYLDKDDGVKRPEKGHFEHDRICGGKDSDSEKQHNVKSSNNGDGVVSDVRTNSGSSKAPDLSRKRKAETPEKMESRQSTSADQVERREQPKNQQREKKSKTFPLRVRDVWEGVRTVRTVNPHKKISININLDGKRSEEKTENQQIISGKPVEMDAVGGEGEFQRDDDVQVEDGDVFKDEMKPDNGESMQSVETDATREDNGETSTNSVGEKEAAEGNNRGEVFDLWRCAFRGDQADKKEEKRWEEGDGTKVSGGGEAAHVEEESLTGEGEEMVREEQQTEERGRNVVEEEPVDGGERREEDEMRSESERNRNEEPKPSRNTDSPKDGQEKITVVKTLEEFIQDGDEREDQLVLIQVPRSKWEKGDSEEDERNAAQFKTRDPFPLVLPPPLLAPTNREMDRENERMRQRSVDTKRDREKEEEERNSAMVRLDRSVAPSSGQITDNSRERERTKDRYADTKRPVERRKTEERGREKYSSPYSPSRKGKSDYDRGKSTKFSGSESTDKVPNGHERRAHRDTLMDSKHKNRNHSHCDDQCNSRGATGTRHGHHSKERHTLSSSPTAKTISCDQTSVPRRRREENRKEKEWRGSREYKAETGAGSCWRDEVD